jgi:toxin ParE1/3/4
MSPDRPLAIRRSRKATTDLSEIWRYIAERNPVAADRVLDEIDRVCRLIATRPKMGRERLELKQLNASIRSFGVMSWVIFYRIDDEFIEIVRVLHTARDLDAIEF